MTSDNLQKALELNRTVKDLLTALNADYEAPPDPKGRSRLAAAFDPSDTSAFDGLTDEEAAAWVIADTNKALEAAVDATKDRATTPTGLDALKAALSGGA